MSSNVSVKEAVRFMVDCFRAVGTHVRAAEQQAELLIQADRRGHPSHGLNRLDFYIDDIIAGVCKPNFKPRVLKENDSKAWVDSNKVLGATSSHFAMDIAIRKAKETGVGWVTVKGANHFGMAGFWAEKAANEDLIGMAFTNSSPFLVPTRSKKAALGTNPLAVAAPSRDGMFYLDMATTAVSVGKVQMQKRKGKPLPLGWAVDSDGNEITDTEIALKTGNLMPLGGFEETSGYKGFGLAAMVEVLCGISSGSKYGHLIRSWNKGAKEGPANLGQCFVSIDLCCLAPGFKDRLSDIMNYWRNMEPVHKDRTVLAPGDKEYKAAAKTDQIGTVKYLKQQLQASAELANKLKVTPIYICDK